jgi:ADP-heptose:LPS heptosyltransferase
VFVIGEKEAHFAQQLSAFQVLNNAPVEQVYSCITSSKLMIANDCGPSHIGHISAVPVIGLFSDEYSNADSTITEWFNQKENSHVIKGLAEQSINSIKVDDVLKTALQYLD